MHEIRATLPPEHVGEATRLAREAGIARIAVSDVYLHGPDATWKVLSVETSTPKARALVEADGGGGLGVVDQHLLDEGVQQGGEPRIGYGLFGGEGARRRCGGQAKSGSGQEHIPTMEQGAAIGVHLSGILGGLELGATLTPSEPCAIPMRRTGVSPLWRRRRLPDSRRQPTLRS